MATLPDKLDEQGIRLHSYGLGSSKILCPQCSHRRRAKRDPCLSVTVDQEGAAWLCHHCGWKGSVSDREDLHPGTRRANGNTPDPASTPPKFDVNAIKPLPPEALNYFATRKIGAETLRKAGVGWGRHFIPAKGGEADCLVFPYRLPGGDIVNAKYRTLDKAFAQVKGGGKVLWLLDQADTEYGDALVIVEGEIDALSLIEAGVPNAVSVPDGAPAKVKAGAVDPSEDRKFAYVWAAKESLERFSKIVLATDADEPGRALAEELARRIGREKCWLVDWPAGCKDANDVLIKHGSAELAACIVRARAYPIKALQEAGAFSGQVLDLYRKGRTRGLPTGWASVSELYTVAPGHVTVVTGVPSSGKSEWIDALMVNLAEAHGWRFAVCSFENPPEEHIAKLVEKCLRKPFLDGPCPRMSESELHEAEAWVGEHFYFIRADNEAPTIDFVLENARLAVLRYGVRGLAIDPYNEIEHKRPDGMSETEYVSQTLSKVRRFAQNHGVHVWFVAHPAKLQRGNDGRIPIPTLYDISGSAHWVNKPDFGIVVHRRGKEEGGATEIHVRKARWKWAGKQGHTVLNYDLATGCYSEPAPSAARAHSG